MRIVHPLLLCFAAIFPLATHALQFPQAPDPELQALVDRFAAESETILDPSLREKPPVQDWPCVQEALMADQQRELQAMLEEQETFRKAQLRAARSQGQDSSMVVGKYSAAIEELVPIRGQCRDGRLEGYAEFWMSSISSMGDGKYFNVSRVSGQYASGKPTGIFRSLTWVDIKDLGLNFEGMDPKMAKIMQKSIKKSEKSTKKMLSNPTVVYQAADGHRKGLKATFTMFDIPLKREPLLTSNLCSSLLSERQVCWTYSGSQLFSRTSLKNYLQHGEQIQFSRELGRGITMPEERKCFDNGVEIKTTTCNVD